MSDLISRQAAIDALRDAENHAFNSFYQGLIKAHKIIADLPSVQPEPAIPLQWIEAHIEWLKSLDNAFSTLTAVQISVMVNKWKDEQNEKND